MNIRGWKWCPFTGQEIRATRKKLGWSIVRLTQELRSYNSSRVWPKTIMEWERGAISPGKAVSLALVEFFRGVWCGDTKKLDLEAWWAANRVLAKEAQLKRLTLKKSLKKSGRKWTKPLTEPDGVIEYPIRQWRPGTLRRNH